MTPELWKRVNAALDGLDGLPPDRREAELARLRRDEPTVAAEVAGLLPAAPASSTADYAAGDPPADTPTQPRSPGVLEDALSRAWRAVPAGGPPGDPDAAPPAVPGCALDGGPENVRYGGMGVVYFGTERTLRRPVAVKVLRRGLAEDPGLVARFRDETLIAAQLQHPGVVPVYAVGELPDGRPYCVMKLVRGETFADVLKRRASPAADLLVHLATFSRVCEALGYAHGKRIVHRDLKPGNVMVGAHDEVLLVDWGLAKKLSGPAAEPAADDASRPVLVDPRTGELETKSGLGTLAYLAPEQANGRVEEVDERSDVFGLGAILCVVLTGRPPYVGPTDGAVERRALRGDLDECFERLEGCGADRELIDLTKRCLSPDRATRPADAAAVAAEVRAYLAGVEERRRQAEVERAKAEVAAREQKRRRRVQLALAATTGLLAAAGGAFMWWEDRRATHLRETELRYQLENERRESEERERATRGRDEFARLLTECEDALRAGNADRARDLLAAAEPRAADLPPDEAAGLARRLAQCRRDISLLSELDDIDRLRWTPGTDRRFPSGKTLGSLWLVAFERFGIRPGYTPPDESARLLVASAVRDRLIGALDLWLATEPTTGVRILLGVADGEAYREQVRSAIVVGSWESVAKLAARDDSLYQPAGFAAALGQIRILPPDRRRQIMEVALQTRPRDLGLLMGLGQLYRINSPNTADARIRWYQTAVTTHPYSVAARHSLGLALLDKGDFAGSERESRAAIGLDPLFAPAHNCLGLALSSLGRQEAAAREYSEAIRLDPSFAQPHANLGTLFAEQNKIDAAVREYQEALRIDPNYAIARFSLGNMRLRLSKDDIDGAIREYKLAIEADPRYLPVRNALGNALQSKGDYKGAIRQYEIAIELDPTFAVAYNNLGDARRNEKDVDGAIAAYREAARLKNRWLPTYRNLAQLLHETGQTYAGLSALRDGERVDSSFRDSLRNDLACFASLVASGRAKDAPPGVDAAALRSEVLTWLREELREQRKLLADSRNNAIVYRSMQRWLKEYAFEPLRGVDKLPAAERAAWAKFWADVRQLRDDTAPRPIAPPPRSVTDR